MLKGIIRIEDTVYWVAQPIRSPIRFTGAHAVCVEILNNRSSVEQEPFRQNGREHVPLPSAERQMDGFIWG